MLYTLILNMWTLGYIQWVVFHTRYKLLIRSFVRSLASTVRVLRESNPPPNIQPIYS